MERKAIPADPSEVEHREDLLYFDEQMNRPKDGTASVAERVCDLLNASMILAENKRKVIERAVQETNASDWKDLGGNAYLQESGAVKAASVLPIEVFPVFRPVKQWAKDDEGEFYLYVCEYVARWSGGLGSMSATGTSSSRDPFFSMREGERLKLSEINEEDIIKNCTSNGRRNAIVRLLGLQSCTWEEVEAFGIRRDGVKTVGFSGKSNVRDQNPAATEDARASIMRMLSEMNHGDPGATADHLEKITSFQGRNGPVKGKREVKWLSEKAVEITLDKVKEEYGRFQNSQHG